ncbi:MAG: hypothetical protein IT281_10225 [Ignavibacteria bacterium]|nr:hypothetical protein [Ignavibacteria bacterium]
MFFFDILLRLYSFVIKNRYAQSASGKVGVIPQNYVEALSDLPEPNEPPPPPLSSFSNPANTYLNRDLTNTNYNTSKPSSQTPPNDPPQYMNPSPYNNWQSQDPPAWSAPIITTTPLPNVSSENLLFDSFIYISFLVKTLVPCYFYSK